MKTKDELNTLKEEAEAVNEKLHELSEEALTQVAGGAEHLEFVGTEPAEMLKMYFDPSESK